MRRPAAVGHIGLTVPDLEGAVHWYQQVLGWKLLMGPIEVSTEDPRVADQLREVFVSQEVSFRQAHMLAADGLAVEIFQFIAPKQTVEKGDFSFWRTGVFHICLLEPEIDALAERIAATGGARRTATRRIFPDEPYLFCYCEDPYGNIIEIATHPHAEAFGGRDAY
jgi:catechol 2,3-dioxygenase-like lactoylglutathione lyase family enzyme